MKTMIPFVLLGLLWLGVGTVEVLTFSAPLAKALGFLTGTIGAGTVVFSVWAGFDLDRRS